MSTLIFYNSRFDSSANYKTNHTFMSMHFFEYVIVSVVTNYAGVCLVIGNHIHWLKKLCNYWSGKVFCEEVVI